MPVQYTNRHGDLYTLIEGVTPGGKPKHHFSRKGKGKPAAALPAGQEVFESAAGQVYLRPIGSALIHPEEVKTVAAALAKLRLAKGFEAWPNKLDVTVYELCGVNDGSFDELARLGGMLMSREQYEEYLIRRAHRMAVMRFVLVKAKERIFAPERYRFCGAKEGWNSIGEPGALESLCRKFVPHVDKESLYELY